SSTTPTSLPSKATATASAAKTSTPAWPQNPPNRLTQPFRRNLEGRRRAYNPPIPTPSPQNRQHPAPRRRAGGIPLRSPTARSARRRRSHPQLAYFSTGDTGLLFDRP